MYRILAKHSLSSNVTRLDVHAPRIAQIRQAGQFVIVHLAENSERIPLTIADSNPLTGSITLVIQAAGKSTNELVALQPGDAIRDVAGPLGQPTEMIPAGHALLLSVQSLCHVKDTASTAPTNQDEVGNSSAGMLSDPSWGGSRSSNTVSSPTRWLLVDRSKCWTSGLGVLRACLWDLGR